MVHLTSQTHLSLAAEPVPPLLLFPSGDLKKGSVAAHGSAWGAAGKATCDNVAFGVNAASEKYLSAGFLTLKGLMSADPRNKISPHLRMRQGI